MRWTNVSDGIPPVSDVSDEILGYSEEVLCQRSDGQTFLGYVRHDMTDWGFAPCWTGRDMYTLDDIVRWISLSEVVEGIERDTPIRGDKHETLPETS